MNTSDFTSLLKNPKKIENQHTVALKSMIEKYPFFQSARVLYLKGLKNQESFKYNNELKVTAAYTTDRTILFDFITAKKLNKKTTSIKIGATTVSKKETASNELQLGKPLPFKANESYSFQQWLQLSAKKPILRKEVPEKSSSKKTLIDRFLQNNPKISRVNKNISIEIPIKENTKEIELMTATLANVYLEQKKYANAIQAYRILSLKYPEKSGFFADQIKRIQILQNNKS